jgi:hypothetical protein
MRGIPRCDEYRFFPHSACRVRGCVRGVHNLAPSPIFSRSRRGPRSRFLASRIPSANRGRCVRRRKSAGAVRCRRCVWAANIAPPRRGGLLLARNAGNTRIDRDCRSHGYGARPKAARARESAVAKAWRGAVERPNTRLGKARRVTPRAPLRGTTSELTACSGNGKSRRITDRLVHRFFRIDAREHRSS